MFDCNLNACGVDDTLDCMFDPIPILLARERVRAGLERPAPEPHERRVARRRAATWLRRLADHLEPQPTRQPRTSP
jgi:hypothetical protein